MDTSTNKVHYFLCNNFVDYPLNSESRVIPISCRWPLNGSTELELEKLIVILFPNMVLLPLFSDW